jgi:selenocysteine lyase/cysteine desulfurase
MSSQIESPGPLACQREAFSLPADRHYLNCAYQSPLARVVEDAGIQGIRMKRDPSAILPHHFFDDADEVRRRFARLVGVGDPQRIAILPSVSYGVAIAAANLPVSRGQNIVLTHEQFPGNVYGWTSLAERRRAEIRTVGPGDPEPGISRAQGWSTRVLEAIDEATAVVTLGHVHWTDGSLFDLAEIGARTREVGAALVIDGTQSVGALPFDVQDLQPDALIVAGYKWLLGPYSIAVGYFGPRFDHGVPLEEGWIARGGSEDFQGLVDYRDDYQPGAVRYDVGERSNFILLPMLREALGLLLEWRPERIQDYCARLMSEAVPVLTEMGYSVPSQGPRAHHILGVRMPQGVDLGRVSRALGEAGVFASLRGSALRVSPNLYNTPEDVGALVDALKAAKV